MQKPNVLIGVTLGLSIVAFVLALWPAVADAPWEQEQFILDHDPVDTLKEPSQGEVCLMLVEAIAGAGENGVMFLSSRFGGGTESSADYWDDRGPWELAGCDEYFAMLAK